MAPQKHQAIRLVGWSESPAISMIFLVKSSKMQNLQDPNIETVLLMIKALKIAKPYGCEFPIFYFSMIYGQFCIKLLSIA
jgi:hypothetical protein